MRESFTYGSVRGAARKGGSYRDQGRNDHLPRSTHFSIEPKLPRRPLADIGPIGQGLFAFQWNLSAAPSHGLFFGGTA